MIANKEQLVGLITDQIFNQYDSNISGALSKFEFSKALNKMSKVSGGMVASHYDLDSIFELID